MNMMFIVFLIICVLFFGGILEKIGMFEVVVFFLLRLVKGVFGIVLCIMVICIIINIIVGE